MDEFCHHGVKGQKWGVRRRRKTTTRASAKQLNGIYDTLSADEKRKLTGRNSKQRPPKTFTTDKQMASEEHVKTFIAKHKKTPVSAFSVWNEGDGDVALSLMTRSGSKYRRKGYGNAAVKRGMKWIDNNPKIKTAYWDVRKDNAGSIALAKKYGFEQMKGEGKDPEWTAYWKRYNRSTK